MPLLPSRADFFLWGGGGGRQTDIQQCSFHTLIRLNSIFGNNSTFFKARENFSPYFDTFCQHVRACDVSIDVHACFFIKSTFINTDIDLIPFKLRKNWGKI